MVVRIDESRHDEEPAALDDLGILGIDLRADLEDLLAFDQNVGPPKIADVWIHRQDDPALQ